MTLGERLRKLREERGVYQKTVAEAIGTSGVTISYYEKGTKKPSREKLQKLADFYGVTTDYLLGNKNSMADLEEEFPEGIVVLRRASKELTPEAKAKMIKLMKAFLDEE